MDPAPASSETVPSVGKLLLARKARTRTPANAPDPSVLRPSIQVSFSGMKQAVKTLDDGTPEVQECGSVYYAGMPSNGHCFLFRFVATCFRNAT
jgi:hypothetical protein